MGIMCKQRKKEYYLFVCTKTADNLVFRIPNPAKLIVLQTGLEIWKRPHRLGLTLQFCVTASLLIGNRKDALPESKDML